MRIFANPKRYQQLAALLIALAAALSGVAAGLRSRGAGNSTYYLDALAWGAGLAGAAFDARFAVLLISFGDRGPWRRAIFRSIAGVSLALGGCLASSLMADALGSLARAVAAAVLVVGVAIGLAGFLTLALTSGADYAARGIDRRRQDDW